VNDFAAGQRAALCAARVAVRAAGVVRDTYVDFIGRNTPDRFSPETAFI
jgi:hypothetical protein